MQADNERASSPERRAYTSPRRAEQADRTRARIRAQARKAFVEEGFNRTTMRRIAARADVSEATVFLGFPTKADLLAAVIRDAVRGPEPEPRVTESVQWRELVALPPEQMLDRFADVVDRILAEAALLLEVGDAAASEHPDLRALRDAGREAEWATIRTLVERFSSRGDLAAHLDADHAADSVAAVASHEVYLRLTRDRGWTREAYRTWLSGTLKVLLLPSR